MAQRKNEPAPLGLWYAWLPGIESEAEAYTLRGRGAEEAVAYVHAAASAAGKIEASANTEVHARSAHEHDAPLLRFTVRLEGRDSVIAALA